MTTMFCFFPEQKIMYGDVKVHFSFSCTLHTIYQLSPIWESCAIFPILFFVFVIFLLVRLIVHDFYPFSHVVTMLYCVYFEQYLHFNISSEFYLPLYLLMVKNRNFSSKPCWNECFSMFFVVQCCTSTDQFYIVQQLWTILVSAALLNYFLCFQNRRPRKIVHATLTSWINFQSAYHRSEYN